MVRRAETVPEGATVRHVDQLSERDKSALYELSRGEAVRAPGLEPGEVVVFTSYYRVVEATTAAPVTTDGPPAEQDREAAPDGGAPSPVRR
ncbi:hypothetical protein ACFQKD_13825 [Halobaculum marinum]|uniref:Uncharacterized protein n=1 Tax=Halobaculum marinum TaxID=3031996 RepID=A0ABD5X2G8_9EURY|nr:hypothetical protein [Halobaculum sp. DT55]